MIALKRIKFLHIVYNLLYYKKLKYQAVVYNKYGIKKWIFSSISSFDLPEDNVSDHPWLDKENSLIALPKSSSFPNLDVTIQSAILNWSTEGYALLRGFYNLEEVDKISYLILKLLKEKKLLIKDKRKIMNAVSHSSELKKLANPKKLTEILNLLMGSPVELYQSVNFFQGSEDPAHTDFIHMSTYPYGYLIAVWIAFEDIDEENGPLFYYPGSHKLPYVMSKDVSPKSNKWLLEKDFKQDYAKKIEEVLGRDQFKKEVFTAKKGDVIIWHANLLHGGSKVIDQHRTRRSMVMHYFGKDVIRYHDVSQRPSLVW